MAKKKLKTEIEAFHGQSAGYLLWQLSRLFNATLSEAIASSGLHMGKVLILATLRAQRELDRGDRLTQTELGRITGIEKSSLVLFLDSLEEDGWVERLRHPTDRRAHIIHLTEDGGRRFEAVGLALYEQQQANLGALDAAEQAQLMALLTKLHDGMIAERN
ncbi:MAG: MarR family transcriptional regulator [Sphingobium sp.]|nr:MarR family transcriptional regulator [Sphingobium sp.]